MFRLLALPLFVCSAFAGSDGLDGWPAHALGLDDDGCVAGNQECALRALQLHAARSDLARRSGPDFEVTATTPLEEVVVASNSFTELDRYKGAVFFGHMNPDADSIGSAFGASEFFGGGAIPACPMQREKCPNAESKFLMDHFHVGLDEVPVLSDVPDLGSKHIVLVDFNAPAKGPNPNFPKDALPQLVKDGRWLSPPVVGSIDHHALQLQGLKVTDAPGLFYGMVGNMSVETHAWGCGCTIIGLKYKLHGRVPSTKAAGLMLGGILSDTLGLTGPTTTEYDREAVAFLSKHAGITDTKALYESMAEAKSAGVLTEPLEKTFDADLKVYDVVPGRAGLVIGSVEVANRRIYQALLSKPQGVLAEAVAKVKAKHAAAQGAEPNLYVFVWIVNGQDKESTLVMLRGGVEACIATHALSRAGPDAPPLPEEKECRPAEAQALAGAEQVVFMHSGSCVSRKAQIQHPLEASVIAYTGGKLTC